MAVVGLLRWRALLGLVGVANWFERVLRRRVGGASLSPVRGVASRGVFSKKRVPRAQMEAARDAIAAGPAAHRRCVRYS